MSQFLIQGYFNELDRIRTASGATRESVVREAFKDLLKQWGRQQNLVFIAEHEHITPAKDRCYVDGALLHEIRVPFGYWEAKDTDDKLDEEIEKKKRKGYPQDNIIFEDSSQAVLIQNRQEVIRCEMLDAPRLEKLLSLFFSYERKEIAAFRQAVEQFKVDLPSVPRGLREMDQRPPRAQGTDESVFLGARKIRTRISATRCMGKQSISGSQLERIFHYGYRIRGREPKSARLDMLGLKWLSTNRKDGSKCTPVFIEMKYGIDAYDGEAGIKKHIQDLQSILSDPAKVHELSQTIADQFNQLSELNLISFGLWPT
ncbi:MULTISPECIES: hypothetical protein [unclassified Bradyrhizobium]|uniref:hypothetical protein n=1 Tax=unclassified Bradyrhizobium TaxID=2631580 RepID=UPI003395FD2D